MCFWNKEDADKAIEQSSILRAETVGSEPVVVSLLLRLHIVKLKDPLGEEEPIQAPVPTHARSVSLYRPKPCPARPDARRQPSRDERRSQ